MFHLPPPEHLRYFARDRWQPLRHRRSDTRGVRAHRLRELAERRPTRRLPRRS